jgi:FKBP-type peptidyl-prolyl cis-trans isomerase SlyD
MDGVDKIGSGKVVSITWVIKDDRDQIVEQNDIPLSYLHGSQKQALLVPLEKALAERQVGDTLEVPVTPDEGFGPHDPNLTYTDDLNNVPPQFRRVGAEVEMVNDQGESKTFYVSKIEDGKLTVDANHPLAGKHVTFIVKVVAVRNATAEELARGEAIGSDLPTGLH